MNTKFSVRFLLASIAKDTALALLWLYKRIVSPWLPPACRFHPTCSDYAAEAFRRHSFFCAARLSICRLAKCGPWHAGGFDPVPEARAACGEESKVKSIAQESQSPIKNSKQELQAGRQE
ncbi:MAG: membrane protein insertion efficiency factor YidD [Candidatus Sumerlaeota bacterium]|nr:membrane protein insertion efficiency factor YidD [Candidatus Sumerlaeota bacterium]